MVQILGGLITCLLMAIYCRQQFNETVSIKRIRELRITILNELYGNPQAEPDEKISKNNEPMQKTDRTPLIKNSVWLNKKGKKFFFLAWPLMGDPFTPLKRSGPTVATACSSIEVSFAAVHCDGIGVPRHSGAVEKAGPALSTRKVVGI